MTYHPFLAALFAQAAAAPPAPTAADTPVGVVTALVTGFLTVLGLMGWVVKHLLTTTIPNQQHTFLEALERCDQRWQRAVDGICSRLEALEEQARK